MDKAYNEFEGTELDPSVDFDWDDEDEGNDLLPIIGASAAVAVVAGGLLVLAGRRRKPTPQERVEDLFEDIQKHGKKGAKAVTNAVEDADLGALLIQARDKARDLSESAVDAVQDSKLADLLDDALTRARQATTRLEIVGAVGDVAKDTHKGLRKRIKKAARNLEALHFDEALDEAVKKARRAASHVDVEGTVSAVRKHAEGIVEAVREEIAPKAVDAVQHAAETVSDTVREDVLPAAQVAVEHVRDDVLPSAGERIATIVEDAELDKKAQRAVAAARSGAGSLADLLRSLAVAILHKVMDELLPEARKMGQKAAQTAHDDVLPKVEDAAIYARHRAGEATTFAKHRAGEVATQTPDVLGDLLKMARERVEDVLHNVEPVASEAAATSKARLADLAGSAKNGAVGVADRAGDAAEYTRHRAEDAGTFARHRASDVAEGLRHGKDNVTGALSSAGHSVTGAVGTAASATAHATREMTGILFWLALLGGLIVMVFIPNRDKQKELWNSAQQLLGELREMWHDMQGSDFDEIPEK